MRRSRQPARDRTEEAPTPASSGDRSDPVPDIGDRASTGPETDDRNSSTETGGGDRGSVTEVDGEGSPSGIGDSDRGAFTAELAAGLPALMLLLSAGLTGVAAVSIKMQCQDAAREAALAEARGEPPLSVAGRIAPDGAAIRLGGDGDSVTADVSAPIRMLGWDLPGVTVNGHSVAAREPEQIAF